MYIPPSPKIQSKEVKVGMCFEYSVGGPCYHVDKVIESGDFVTIVVSAWNWGSPTDRIVKKKTHKVIAYPQPPLPRTKY